MPLAKMEPNDELRMGKLRHPWALLLGGLLEAGEPEWEHQMQINI